MPYGTIKVDNITFDNGGTDKLLTVSGLFFSTSGALTVTGTIAGGNVTAPTATFTTLTGTTTAGTTATFTSGSFTSLTGVTTTVTSGIFGAGTAAAPSIAFSGDSNTGIYSPGADTLAFVEGGTEAMRIASNGFLLVGTSSAKTASRPELGIVDPVTPITQIEGYQIYTDEASRCFMLRGNSTTNIYPYFALVRSKGSALGSNTSVASGDNIGALSFQGMDGTNPVEAASITASVDGTPGANDMPGRLVFSTTADGLASPTERMRITSGGYIKASNTGTYTDAGGGSRETNLQHFFRSDQNGLTVQATNTNTSGAVEGFTSDFATGATGKHFIGAVNLVRVFVVDANGNVSNTNNVYGAISDVKLKENIVDANSQWSDLKALRICNYNLKTGESTHTQIGLIAQEVELISPGLVSESPDFDREGNELGTVTKSVNYSVLYMKAVKALQEAMERIETLEARLTALERA